MYHATKWGIEGFVEAVAQKVVSFRVGMVRMLDSKTVWPPVTRPDLDDGAFDVM